MLQTFRTYQLSVQFYRRCKALQLSGYVRDQLLRAASSVTLNLAEGSARPTRKDRLRFYHIAFASLREIQGLVDLERERLGDLDDMADHLGACLYKLVSQ